MKSEEAATQRRSAQWERNPVTKIFSWILLFLCLGYMIYLFSRNWSDIGIIANLDMRMVILLLVFQAIYLVLHALRYWIILQFFGGLQVGFPAWFRIYVLGRVLNLVMPQSGNVVRGIYLKRRHGVSYTRYVGSYFAFAWIGSLLGAGLALLVVSAFEPELRIADWRATPMMAAIIVGLFLGPWVLEVLWRKWPIMSRRMPEVGGKIHEILTVSVQLFCDANTMAKFGGVSILMFGTAGSVFYLCFGAYGIDLELEEVAIFLVLLQLTSYINLTPANLGVQELAFGFISDGLGIGMSEGVLVSLLVRVTGYIALFCAILLTGGANVVEYLRSRSIGRPRERNDS